MIKKAPHNLDYELPSKNPWIEEGRWILHSASLWDGVYRVKDSNASCVLVRFGYLAKAAAMLQRPSPLLTNVAPAQDANVGILWKQAFLRNAPESIVARHLHQRPIHEIAAEAGWEVPDTVDHEYALLNLRHLADWLATSRSSRVRYHRRNLAAGEAVRGERKVASLQYTDEDGLDHVIKVTLRGNDHAGIKRPFFTLPAFVDSIILHKERVSAKGKFMHVGSDVFWSLPAISFLASLRVDRINPTTEVKPGRLRRSPVTEYDMRQISPGDGPLEYDWAEHFVKWVATKALEVPTQMHKLLYDQAQPKRLLEIAQGERTGAGRYTEAEDAILKRFFETRAPGTVQASEWDLLSEQMPYRAVKSIQTHVMVLAFEYAKQHGWNAYIHSGYAIKSWRTEARRRQWRARGVPA
jgi:hypothetical protein